MVQKGPDHPAGGMLVKSARFLGSGFFVEGKQSIAFVTARHVVDIDKAADEVIVVGNLSDNSKHSWDGFEFHSTADLAIARFKKDKAPTFARPLPLYTKLLRRGQRAYSFGFPFSGALDHQPPGKLVVTIEEFFMGGYVSNIYSASELGATVQRPFSTNYALDFASPGGLSGAPLLFDSGEADVVAGIMYWNQDTSLLVDEYVEKGDGSSTSSTVSVKRVYQFGLAGTILDLGELLDF